MTQIKYWVVIPAAGIGQRFGAAIPKQYARLNGKTVIEQTLAKFLYHPRIEKIVVVINANDYIWPQLGLETHNDKIMVATGGQLRSDSVYAGLQAMISYINPQDFILVHDAVRPCISHSDIDKLIDCVGHHPIGGILGSKVRDTLKRTNATQDIVDTVDRDNIWQALTPQMFRYKLLAQALQSAIVSGHPVSDEAAAIEAMGFIPMIVEGRNDNIKITFAEDLRLAEKYCN